MKRIQLEEQLAPWQRVHLAILSQAREDWVTARSLDYITERGAINPPAFRFKGNGNQLIGGFSNPMTIAGLHDLVSYWNSNAPMVSVSHLCDIEMDAEELLNRLNEALINRPAGVCKLPEDEL